MSQKVKTELPPLRRTGIPFRPLLNLQFKREGGRMRDGVQFILMPGQSSVPSGLRQLLEWSMM